MTCSVWPPRPPDVAAPKSLGVAVPSCASHVPGQFYDVAFDLQPDYQVIPAGKRLALMVFSSDKDFTLWPEPGTKLEADLAGTSLDFPVVGGKEAWEKAVAGGVR
jgi:hypothetical protein